MGIEGSTAFVTGAGLRQDDVYCLIFNVILEGVEAGIQFESSLERDPIFQFSSKLKCTKIIFNYILMNHQSHALILTLSYAKVTVITKSNIDQSIS